MTDLAPDLVSRKSVMVAVMTAMADAMEAKGVSVVGAVIDAINSVAPPIQTPICETCGGYGEVYGHSDDCRSDYCALAGGMDDCDGEVVLCHCFEQRDDLDCARCGGDCSSANPSVMFCPLAPEHQSDTPS